jgi:hypothetical protein
MITLAVGVSTYMAPSYGTLLKHKQFRRFSTSELMIDKFILNSNHMSEEMCKKKSELYTQYNSFSAAEVSRGQSH